MGEIKGKVTGGFRALIMGAKDKEAGVMALGVFVLGEIAWRFSLLLVLLAGVFFAASIQVWQFPYPRISLFALSFFFFHAAIKVFAVYYLIKISEILFKHGLKFLSSIMLIAGVLTMIWATRDLSDVIQQKPIIENGLECLFEDNPACVAKHQQSSKR